MTTQMQGEVVYSWNPATDNCSSTTSVVSTVNCGSCPETINTTDNSVTCRGVIDVQDCSVSIQTVTQCSISDSVAFPVMGMIILIYDLNKINVCLARFSSNFEQHS